jgi:hypothetical protein
MSEELLKAIEVFDWEVKDDGLLWRIHYDPQYNGRIVQIAKENQSTSDFPYIEVDALLGKEFVTGKRYQRDYHVVHDKLELIQMEHNVHAASDKRIDQLVASDNIDPGTYFITVKGDPDLVIDTVLVTEENIETESQKIQEYLQHNDVFKDQ